jgi:uncharacterized protein with beta-barrel porin domain
VNLGDVELVPSVTLGWQHALGDVVPRASLAFAGATQGFGVAGAPVERDMALVGAGVSYGLPVGSRIRVEYTGQIGARATQSAFTAEYALPF